MISTKDLNFSFLYGTNIQGLSSQDCKGLLNTHNALSSMHGIYIQHLKMLNIIVILIKLWNQVCVNSEKQKKQPISNSLRTCLSLFFSFWKRELKKKSISNPSWNQGHWNIWLCQYQGGKKNQKTLKRWLKRFHCTYLSPCRDHTLWKMLVWLGYFLEERIHLISLEKTGSVQFSQARLHLSRTNFTSTLPLSDECISCLEVGHLVFAVTFLLPLFIGTRERI